MITSAQFRFIFTLGANLARSAISLGTSILLARWLGPQGYGQMSFLLGTFLALFSLLDMGSSTAFFTFLSQKTRSRKFVARYFWWMALQGIIPLLIIAYLLPSDWLEYIWKGESRSLLLLASLTVFFQGSLWPVVSQAGESQRQSIRVQSIGFIIVLVHSLLILVLNFLNYLTLNTLFGVIIMEYFLAACITIRGLDYAEANASDEDERFTLVLTKYGRYCLPLIPYTAVSFFSLFVDRWLLQTYGGNVEQAYYAVGAQFSSIALIAATSIVNILRKEIAEANFRGNIERMRVIYHKVSYGLFFIGTFIAGFLIPWSKELLQLLLGDAYTQGALCLAIMFLYPIHQTMGHVNSSMLYATERVSTLVTYNIVSMLIGIVVTYFVIAPPTASIPGLGMGSLGLAVKMVVIQCVSVNILMFAVSKIWHWRFEWAYQLVNLSLCLGIGWVVHALAIILLGNVCSPLLMMLIASIVFTALMIPIILFRPQLIGFTKNELLTNLNKINVLNHLISGKGTI